MFDLITKPVVSAVRAWMADQVHKAAREGAAEGLHRFAAELTAATAELPAPVAVPLPMPSAAQVTAEDDQGGPALDATAVERLRELIAGGMSQRAAAAQLGIPESTARRWLKA